jgi:hypothetical protein
MGTWGLSVWDLPAGRSYTLSASVADAAGNVGTSPAVVMQLRGATR